MEKKEEKTNELTREQMEKATGGEILTDTGSNPGPAPINSMETFKCPGNGCGQALKYIGGNLYRCTNPLCPLFALDQFPAGH